tara:strand:+ start:196 stop:951 length:756 start_codon:yes stop_codon:yes gene_type:complete
MGKGKPLCMLALLLTASIAGCLESPTDESMLSLRVDYESSNGTVLETYVDGELISLEQVVLDFDFSKTTSTQELKSFGVDLMDGSAPVLVNAEETSIISISFDHHGVHNITLFATDQNDDQQNESVSIRINLRIEWTEANTNDPLPLLFNPTPKNGGIHPMMIEINSTVENPSLIDGIGGGGQTVQFSWNIVDELNDVCQSKNGQAEDGKEDTWYTIYFSTHLLHELKIIPEDGQDYLNVHQNVSVIYSSD